MKHIKKDIRKANTLEGSFYNSERYYQKCQDYIFSKTWQFICDDSDVKTSKSTNPFTFMKGSLNEPFFLIRNETKNIKCFSNVCTHRGNILIQNKKTLKNQITCKYHGRKFDTCGNFISMPATKGMKDFPSKKDNLISIPTEKWKQFIFVAIEPKIRLKSILTDIENRIGWIPVEKFVYDPKLSKNYTVNANWALYCDNYLEGFHIPFIHKDLNTELNHSDYDVELFRYSNLQIGIGKHKKDCFLIPKSSTDYGKNIAAYYFWIFPNLMLNFYPWGLSINIVKPLSLTKTRVEFRSYIWDASKLKSGAGKNIDKVELEDEEIVESVQKGVTSRYYRSGRFSPTMEKGVHHFHSLISDFMQDTQQ